LKVLIIEDNPRLAERIKDHLHKYYLVEVALTGDEGIAIASTHTVDVILLDLNLPDMPGLEVCQKIRELGVVSPVIVLTGIDTSNTKVDLLNAGADDYMTKPFVANELRARINALERRRQRKPPETTLRAGDLTLNSASRTVERSGQQIQLRRKEFDILEYLLKNKGRVLSRQMIINHAWISTTVAWTGSVDVHIKQLRDKVDKPFNTPLIKTSYGVGYSIESDKIVEPQQKVN
jgi:DNA-binding response OmpR family regulator